MDDIRIIKKYPNRRLYDTAESRYVTLEGIRKLVKERIPFQVVDSRSGKEITRSVLLQIITEQEEKGDPILSSDVLTRIIRLHGDLLQTSVSHYLEKSLGFFMEQQVDLQKQLLNTPADAGLPLAMMEKITDSNIAFWQQWQNNLFSIASGAPTKKTDSDES
ncbi:MAG: polyhydroxyalkanoate synthesis repressor PhaR [Magnetococcales bacterium]|nr:polyhydroxyalkanoate synthesis repressor PhaR [Magnetococcales bacterium]